MDNLLCEFWVDHKIWLVAGCLIWGTLLYFHLRNFSLSIVSWDGWLYCELHLLGLFSRVRRFFLSDNISVVSWIYLFLSMATVVLPLSDFVINMWGLFFKKVLVNFEFSITRFWKQLRELCFWLEKLFTQLTNFNLAAFLSFSWILWMLDSKSAIKCFVGILLGEKGVPKFFPRPSVFATTGGICVSLKLINQESVRGLWWSKSSGFERGLPISMRRWNLDLQLLLCVEKIRSIFLDSKKENCLYM